MIVTTTAGLRRRPAGNVMSLAPTWRSCAPRTPPVTNVIVHPCQVYVCREPRARRRGLADRTPTPVRHGILPDRHVPVAGGTVIQSHLRRYGMLSALFVTAGAGTRADELGPTTRPVIEQAASDKRPRLALVGFTADPNGDPRDAWIPVALEELAARRLQRVSGVLVVPTIRLHQGRRELSDSTQAPAWPDVARGLGATHLVACECRGPDNAVSLSVALRLLDRPDAAGPQTALPPGRLYEALDALTRWLL